MHIGVHPDCSACALFFFKYAILRDSFTPVYDSITIRKKKISFTLKNKTIQLDNYPEPYMLFLSHIGCIHIRKVAAAIKCNKPKKLKLSLHPMKIIYFERKTTLI